MDICEQCGGEYERIGAHWSKSSICDYPSLTNHQIEVATGLMMGDGCINRVDNNPRLRSKMISYNYLEYIDEQFGIFGYGVSLETTAEESAKKNRDIGFSPNAKAENYSDVYCWRTMSHPDLKPFEKWYDSGEKVWPVDIELTPTVLKHWYCGDGNWHNGGTHNNIRIAMSNERKNTEKVDRIFDNAGLPSPNRYGTNGKKCNANFNVDQSEELWKYMGKPLPDFEYKWPDKFK